MKNTILIFALITISMDLFAQTDSIHTGTIYKDESKYNNMQNNNIDRRLLKNDSMNNDCTVAMINGKMMTMKNGKMAAMDKEMVMKNGSRVMLDGTMRMKGGETIRINEGDCLDQSGRLIIKGAHIKSNSINFIKQ